MKQILIFSLFLAAVFYMLPVLAESTVPPTVENLDGRELVVRVYNDWRLQHHVFGSSNIRLDETEVFEKVSIRVQGRAATLGSLESAPCRVDGNSVVVIIPDDQTDQQVRDALCDTIYAEVYNKKRSFYLPRFPGVEEKLWTFRDALGTPIPQVVVHIFLSDYENPTKLWVRTVQADEQGRLKAPGMTGRFKQFYLIVSEFNYGTAIVGSGQLVREEDILLPLVRTGTEIDSRSIWGVVLDPDGNPVPCAVISCRHLLTPAGGEIFNFTHWRYAVLTDEQGKFAMHLPIKKTIAAQRIPPDSQYAVTVRPPKSLGLLSFSGRLRCGQESKVVLESAGYFRTFVFEDANGPITDVNKLELIHINIKHDNAAVLRVNYPDWKDGKMLPPGTYEAATASNIRPLGFERYEFEPVQVTAQSPQMLVFKAKQKPRQKDILYRGQVVHGITGETMPGAFIIVADYPGRDFAVISIEQWKKLHQLDTTASPDDPALEPIKQIAPFQRILRTGEDGSFQFRVKSIELFRFLVAFEEDYLAVQYDLSRKDLFKPDENNLLDLPVIRLYPAAKVIIEPCVEEPFQDVLLRMRFGDNSNLDWIHGFFAFYEGLKAPFVRTDRIHPPDMLVIMHIPAGMNVMLTMTAFYSNRSGSPWGCPIFTDTINAEQGHTIDLGQVKIQREIPVYVKVIDSAGNPLEGVAVAHGEADGKTWFGQKHITNASGMAKFYAHPYHSAAFFIRWDKRNVKTPGPRQSLIYETTGPQDANSVYTFQLSDEVLDHIFK